MLKFFWCIIDRNYDVITFVSNAFILRRLTIANFDDIIKIPIMFIKKYLKTQKKLKELCVQMQSISVFLGIAKFSNFWSKNANVIRPQVLCHVSCNCKA